MDGESILGSGGGERSTPTKGKGLKKWKRIQRRSLHDDASTTSTDLNPFSKRTPATTTTTTTSDRSMSSTAAADAAPNSNRYHHTAAANNNKKKKTKKKKKKPSGEEAHSRSTSVESHSSFSPLLSLQNLHQALEKEIQNFGEIGKEPIYLPDVSTGSFLLNPEFHYVVSEVHETNSSGQVPFEGTGNSCSMAVEAELIDSHGDVYILKRKLEEVMTMLEVKESRVVELEGVLHDRGVSKGEAESLSEKCKEMETELDDLFKAKIEAEVECLTMRKACQKLRAASKDQNALFEEQKTMIGEPSSILLHKCRDAENKNVVMKEEVDELASRGESLESKEVVKMGGGIWKYTFCFSFQLVLLVLAFLQLWPGGGYNTGFVPT